MENRSVYLAMMTSLSNFVNRGKTPWQHTIFKWQTLVHRLLMLWPWKMNTNWLPSKKLCRVSVDILEIVNAKKISCVSSELPKFKIKWWLMISFSLAKINSIQKSISFGFASNKFVQLSYIIEYVHVPITVLWLCAFSFQSSDKILLNAVLNNFFLL